MESNDEKRNELVEIAIDDKDIPHIYCNGFTNVLGGGDIMLVLQQNQRPQATINLSFSLAKTLSVKLGQMIKLLENKTGNRIMTTDEIQTSLMKNDNE